MTRKKTIPVYCLNLAMHAPHSPERYVELLQACHRHVVELNSPFAAMIGSLYAPASPDDSGLWAGEFYQFLNIDVNDPWFDLNRREQASDGDKAAVSIPSHLKPELTRFSFVFDPVSHLMVVQMKQDGRSFGAGRAQKLLDRLFAHPRMQEFPSVEVTALPQRDAVERMLKLPHLSQLKISLVRPNPDDLDKTEAKLMGRLAGQNAKRMDIVLQGAGNQSLTPDEETRAVAQVAAHNGVVSVVAKNSEGKTVATSTLDVTRIEHVDYNPNVTSVVQVLRNALSKFK